MFPSSSSSSRHNSPFPQTNENPNSKHKRPSPPPPSLFLHFPSSPFLDNDHPLVDHLLSQHFIVTTATSTIAAQAESDNINMAAASILNNDTTSNATAPVALKMKKRSSNTDAAKKPTPRKRTGKKDRHSKIYTAQGLRDRRMRLSLQIARKFFDLQDMLGFDKASKTIEWLFTKSKAAIKELTGNLPQIRHSGGCVGGKNNIYMSSSSGCKVIRSEMKENGNNREKKSRKSRNAAFDTIAKESREKARARARERTREKMMMRSLEKLKQCSDQTNPNNLEQVGSSSPFETGDQESGCRSQEMNSSLKNVAEVEEPISTLSLEHQMGSVGIIEKFLGMTSTARSVSIGNYSNNVAVSSGIISNSDFPGFPGDWDMEKARTIHSNYYAATNMDPSTGNVQEQNPSSSFMTTTSNICLRSQVLENQLSCFNPLDSNNNQSLY